MEKQVHTVCVYSEENTIEEAVLSAFRSFLDRVVSEESEHVA